MNCLQVANATRKERKSGKWQMCRQSAYKCNANENHGGKTQMKCDSGGLKCDVCRRMLANYRTNPYTHTDTNQRLALRSARILVRLCVYAHGISVSVDYELQTFSAMFVYFAPPRCAVVTPHRRLLSTASQLPAACYLCSSCAAS
uniref:Calcitonin gene-related peptide type 1 receptor n=1 Tax=Zeugodacus cucurbitae TaxID=28588 RepID=A0A0A1WI84_ZEUCU